MLPVGRKMKSEIPVKEIFILLNPLLLQLQLWYIDCCKLKSPNKHPRRHKKRAKKC